MIDVRWKLLPNRLAKNPKLQDRLERSWTLREKNTKEKGSYLDWVGANARWGVFVVQYQLAIRRAAWQNMCWIKNGAEWSKKRVTGLRRNVEKSGNLATVLGLGVCLTGGQKAEVRSCLYEGGVGL